MDIHFTVRSKEVRDAAREYLKEKLHKLDKVHLNIVDAHAILDIKKYRNIVEVALSGKHIRLAAKEEDKDMIIAIDRVILKLNHQLLKHKEILKQKKGASARQFAQNDAETEAAENA